MWVTITLAIAGLADPFLFIALVRGIDRHQSRSYRAAATLIFLALTTGFGSLPIITLTR
ncbi:hypothetical protein GCM10022222_01110 [Amycolatopsis ultiminotia]|uniref:Uncharacterized protein n=1 Tax=Amycolatopsis ultiminotia TaxID=543629 RepID=A0ABP6UVH7_9PSEU